MPVKSKSRKKHHTGHHTEKRTKHFLKVYAPFIPLLLIVATGFTIATHGEFKRTGGTVQGYATNVNDTDLLSETNKQRLAQGLPALSLSSSLDAAAQTKAEDMAAKNYWSHTSPDGKEPWAFIEEVKYPYQKAAENLAYGFSTSTATVNGWMNSPGHRANILDSQLKQVGFGLVNVADYQGHGPETIVVAMYADPAVAANATPVLPITTANATPQSISFVQSVTAGKAPWSSFALGIVVGLAAMYLVATHARGVRRAFATSENFVIHHPLLDTTIVSLAVLALVATQTIGSIY